MAKDRYHGYGLIDRVDGSARGWVLKENGNPEGMSHDDCIENNSTADNIIVRMLASKKLDKGVAYGHACCP